MRRLVVAIGVLVLSLAPPAAAAQTGVLTWSQPGSFTATAPGANPDHDAFGGTPWSYAQGAALTRLPTFATGLSGGVSGWEDSAGTTIGVDPSAATELVMAPAGSEQAALAWTSPLPASTLVTISGTIAPASSSCLLGGYTWSLERGTTVLASGTDTAATISASTTVAADGSIALLVSPPGIYSAACATADVSLSLTASATAPAISLATPTAGSVYVSPAQPLFTGTAATAYGDSKQVTVQIYSGSTATGAPVQTLTATESGDQFSVLAAPLSTGSYTAVVQQSDLATPPDVASTTVGFTVTATGSGSGSGAGASGSFVLNPPPAEPLGTSSPTLTGTAPAANAGAGVTLSVYAGAGTTGTAVRRLSGTINADGSFAFTIAPSLSDGLYTAQATETVGGAPVSSLPVEFVLKVNAPALTLISPRRGGNSTGRPVFYGLAGDVVGDFPTVQVTLYAGAKASGRALGTETTQSARGVWIQQWQSSLPLGLYTVQARQSDIAGHTTTTSADTFLVVPGSTSIIGTTVAVAQNGLGSVPVVCPGRPSTTCQGTITVASSGPLRPAGGGAKRKLTLFRTSFTATGATTLVVRAQLSGEVRRTLRPLGHVRVAVTLSMSVAGASSERYTATRRATIAR